MRKYRDKLGLYLIEGSNALEEAKKCDAKIEAVFVKIDCFDKFAKAKGSANVLADVQVASDLGDFENAYLVNEALFKNIAQTETSQGIVAIVKKRDYSEKEFANLCKDGNILVLDRLQDPGNIGTMIRTADAAGYKGVICLKGTGDVFSPKVVRAAAGSIFRIPILFVDTETELLTLAQKLDKRVVSTCFDTELDYFDADLKNNVALLIGNEGSGLSKELIDGSDIKVKIPMQETVDSLNAAVAAGILMYERIRKG